MPGNPSLMYRIDNTIDLDELRMIHGHNTTAIRLALEAEGLEWFEANQFAIFTVYGFSDPRGQPTLDSFQLIRLSLHLPARHEDKGTHLSCQPMNHTPGRPSLN